VLVSGDGSAAAIIGARGAGVFSLAGGSLLPVQGELTHAWRRGARGFVGARRDGSLIELRARAPLAVSRGLHGRSALAVHEASRRIAVGDSFGTVQVAHLDSGVQETIRGPVRVIKSLSFSSDGRFLALGAAGPEGLLVFDTASSPPRVVPGPWQGDPRIRARHVAFLDATHFVFFGWGAPTAGARFDAALDRFVEVGVPALPADMRELAVREGELWAVDASGGLHRLTLGPDGFRVDSPAPGLGAERVAVSPDGRRRAVSSAAGAWRLEPFASAPREVASPVEALAIADDGRLALCRRDGVVELRDADDVVLLEAPAHEQRCAKVVFCDAQLAVCSVGWDGRLRVMEAR
jgi:WD40 repeat protein